MHAFDKVTGRLHKSGCLQQITRPRAGGEEWGEDRRQSGTKHTAIIYPCPRLTEKISGSPGFPVMPQRQQDPSPDDGRRHGPRWKVVNTPTCPLHGHAGILGTGDKVSPDTVLLVFYAHSTIMVISGRASVQKHPTRQVHIRC